MLGVAGSLHRRGAGQHGGVEAAVGADGVGGGKDGLGELCGSHRNMLAGVDSGLRRPAHLGDPPPPRPTDQTRHDEHQHPGWQPAPSRRGQQRKEVGRRQARPAASVAGERPASPPRTAPPAAAPARGPQADHPREGEPGHRLGPDRSLRRRRPGRGRRSSATRPSSPSTAPSRGRSGPPPSTASATSASPTRSWWQVVTTVTGSVELPVVPPVAGEHNAAWQNCTGNVYDAPIANEHAVHSLEHGAIWITYRPDLARRAGRKLPSGSSAPRR